jgi:hypothetical protein
VSEPRSASAAGKDFPYKSPTTCFIEVAEDGTVTQGGGHEAYERASAGKSRLFAVWPGRWSSDLFVIDDLEEYARAIGIVHDEGRTGLAEHEHDVSWTVSPYEKKPDGLYITIEVRLNCGCQIRDLKTFASHMREQKGWEIATTRGWGGGGSEEDGYRYHMRVRRTTLSV